jgi:hypothetical protein
MKARMDIAQARHILTAEAEARRTLKEARADAYLEALDNGKGGTAAWQVVILNTTDEQQAFDSAHIEATLLRMNAGMQFSEDGEQVVAA